MYAVIRTGGKQYRVQEGDVLRVASLDAEAGKKVSFDDVLLIGEGDAIKMGMDTAKSSVAAEVLTNGLGKKVQIFKKRRRKHSQRTQGHRQAYTSVRITGIGAAKAAPAKKASAGTVEKAKPTAEKAVAKKPATKKATTAKATAKPAAKKASASASKAVEKKATAKKAAPKTESKKSDKE